MLPKVKILKVVLLPIISDIIAQPSLPAKLPKDNKIT
jgi:hypothetical protein